MEEQSVLIAYAVSPKLTQIAKRALFDALRRRFDPFPPLLVVEDGRPGHNDVDVSFLGTAESAWPAAAMAASVLQACWSWDESPEIRIAGRAGSLLVAPRVESGRWLVALVPRRAGET